MYSLSQFDEDDLFQKYKRQSYLAAFPFGILLIILYITNTLLVGAVLYFAIFMIVELCLLTLT